ncbi:zf-HC2 domain-containing protein [Kangiella sediminilitoris]|uniref:Putative transmembrane anti-sigma factor n=1 Tax=Kangiella sediminilitoris TaxID=1144748 RepID=A0A1B3B818_9GAMM|nr:zf-HC2 domain-containing protein [Kangiella sediminilitoris]AOE48939.1 Putative transmembrane anti-sigma factor [Kangiella sediminilitoris]
MLSCKHVVEQGSDYIDNELSIWRKLEMRLHLVICVHCRRYIKQLHRTVIMLSRGHYNDPGEQQLENLKQEYKKMSKAQS